MERVSLNGALVAREKAVVPVTDRGFRLGDGVFETLLIHAGMPYLWAYHLERLTAGMGALGIALSQGDLLTQALALIAANQVRNGLLRIQVSRGTGARGYLPDSIATTWVMETFPSAPAAHAATLWLCAREKISPRALPTQYKTTQGLSSTLALMEAAAQGCDEALLLSAERFVVEAAGANLFWLSQGRLYTPSLASGALAGITRRRLMELSPYPVEEGAFDLKHLTAADSVVLTNAATGVRPVQGLKSPEKHWASQPLADELNRLRNDDIIQDTSRLRESLVRT